jgi:hypothetical protein
MFNAKLASKNFGGQRSMLTLSPAKPAAMDENINATSSLLVSSKPLGTITLGGTSSKSKEVEISAKVFEATNGSVTGFLKAYRWLESDYKYPARPTDTALQIEFLEKQKHGIAPWLIVAPQRKESFGQPLTLEGVGQFAVKERHRVEGRGFQVFGEPIHRMIAEFLVGIKPGKPDSAELTSPTSSTKKLLIKNRGVCLLYPVREEQKDKVSMGFELFFPENDIPFDINFTVRRKTEGRQVVVQEAARA